LTSLPTGYLEYAFDDTNIRTATLSTGGDQESGLMSEGDLNEETGSGDIRAVIRAADVLGLFGDDTPEITVADVSERIGLNRTTAYRYCTSLLSAGLLERGTQPNSFIPGGALLRLGAFALGTRQVMDLSAPHMRNVAEATGATTVLSLWTTTGPVVSRVEEGRPKGAIVTVRVGTQLALTTAQGITFLAFLTDRVQSTRFLAMLPEHEQERVESFAQALRKSGYCFTTSRRGIAAIATPVFNEFGCCATLAVIGTNEMLPESSTLAANELVTESRALSKEMGGASFWPQQTA
jgi:DNA-binding IclR family transcriptional regulator